MAKETSSSTIENIRIQALKQVQSKGIPVIAIYHLLNTIKLSYKLLLTHHCGEGRNPPQQRC